MKRMMTVFLALTMLLASSAAADSAIDVIMNIGTTQAFTDEAVSTEDLETILKAGLAAASAMNQQPWYFVAVTNQDLMKEIAGSGMSFTPPAGGATPEGAPEGAPGAAPEGAPGAAPEGRPDSMPAPSAAAGGAKASVGDSPAAIVIYKSARSKSPNADYDCGLATQNMVIAAGALGYGVKIVSSPTMTLNGGNHDALCEKMGVDPSMQAVAVLLIGRPDSSTDAVSGATSREGLESKTSIIE